VETAVISYRVADFLKQQPPFNAVDDADLLALAAGGRVRFYEPNEYVLWQGEPHRYEIYVIQQGSVSLWDESAGETGLRDVRGAGDMLGLERYNDARRCLYSVRSESDVVIYAFPADDFEQSILKYPHAEQFVAAEARVTPDYHSAQSRRDPHQTFLRSLVGQRPLAICRATDSLASVAAQMLASRAEAVAVLDADQRPRAILTAEALVGWVSAGGGDARHDTVETLTLAAPATAALDAVATDGVITMASTGSSALAITTDGTTRGQTQALVTAGDLATLFRDQPVTILRDIRLARRLEELRELNVRLRALALEHLTSAHAVDWLARLSHQADVAILSRLLAIAGVDPVPGCWCFCASSGRAESLTGLAPHVTVISGADDDPEVVRNVYETVVKTFPEVGYLPRDLSFPAGFHVARAAEWSERYREWVRDPLREEMHRARALFDVRPVLGHRPLWESVDSAIAAAVQIDFLHILANDCLATVPPLTFYQDAVVDSSGEHLATFRLEQSALRPLVDVGRVFGLACGAGPGRSTLERFTAARTRLPEHESIFREAADTFRVVLWQQGRIGISQGTAGAELPPSLLSRHDRHILKSGFRSILRLIEFTGDRDWLGNL
jgi:CBS domain-containing protein